MDWSVSQAAITGRTLRRLLAEDEECIKSSSSSYPYVGYDDDWGHPSQASGTRRNIGWVVCGGGCRPIPLVPTSHYTTKMETLAGIQIRLIFSSVAPRFLREPQQILDFTNNTGGFLHCVANGDPKPSISWTFADGNAVVDIPGLRRMLSNGSLYFLPFSAQEYRQDVHATVYRCQVSNIKGTIVSRDVKVRAVVLQIYEAQVYDEFVIKGNTAVLKCHIPTFVADYVTVTSWRQDETFIYPDRDEGAKYTIMPSGELHIVDVQLNDANPSYRCYTKHQLTGEIRSSAASGCLYVTYPLGSVPPRITDSKISVTAKEGSVTILPCVAQGFPLPEITWYFKKDDDTLSVIQNDRKFRAISSGLKIVQVSVHDSRVYVCIANNTVGSEKLETSLTVVAPLSAYIQPERKVADLGQSASFHCVTSGLPITSLIWLKNGKPLMGDKGFRYMKDILQFSNVQREDQGVYQCLIASDIDSAQASAELILGDISPVLHYGFPESVVNPGIRLSLQCVTSGSPQPEISWTLDGQPVSKTNRIAIESFSDGTGKLVSFLNITNVRTEDGGYYSCSVVNKAGHLQHTSRLNVHGRPYIRALPKISAVAGHDLTISCPAAGYPISSIKWERGGRELPISHHQVVFPNGTLQVKGIQRPLDSGKYTCKVSNRDGQMASRDFEVMILVPPHITPFSFMDDYMLEGVLARITCVVSRGDHPLSFTWVKDGRLITPDLGITVRTFDEHSVVLTINNVTSKHNGNYTCIANNPAGSANHTAHLVVNVPPRWIVEPEDVAVLAGNKVVLNCQVEGYPIPTIQWMKAVDNKPGEYKTPDFNDPNVKQYYNGSLVLKHVRPSDAGQYLCQASNGIGAPLGLVIKVHVQVPVHFEIMSINQTAKRGEKTKLKCEAKGELPIRVSWLLNGNNINFESLSRFNHQEFSSTTGLTSEVNILRVDRKDTAVYTCVAANKYGRDEQSIHLTIIETPEAPGNLKFTNKTSRSIAFSWLAPFNGNIPILKYTVQYKLVSFPWTEKAINVTVPGGETTVTVSHLQPATNYHVRIFAINGLGNSEPSDVIGVTTLEEAPAGPPVDVKSESVGPDAVKVTWKPPKRDLWNGQVLGYYIGYKLHESPDSPTFETYETSDNSVETLSLNLTGLKKFTRYSIIVQAYNHVGTSPRSEELVVLTSEDVPSMAPEDVKCSALSSQSLHISWNVIPSGFTNGILQGYKVIYSPVEDWYTDKIPEIKITPGLKTVLSGLEKYTNYSIEVLGYTKIGDGTKSLAIYCTTNEDVPEAPADVKVASTSSTTALITWKMPSRLNGNIVKFTVYKRTTDREKEDIEKYAVPLDRLQHETNELKKGHQYEFWVTASTSIGEGQSTRVVTLPPSSTAVPAKVMSFGGQLNVSLKSSLLLPCRAVGLPTPDLAWKFRGQPISSSSSTYIEPSGDLIINSVQVTDAGTYVCAANNKYGLDEITYLVQVLVPPSPPRLVISATAYHTLEVHWKLVKEEEIPITEYHLYYKRDFGEWVCTLVGKDRNFYVLENLECGTRYHIYITAVNRIGKGHPSETVVTRTEGASPVMPRKHAFVRENSNFVTLHLDAWISGCDILYFVVHYKLRSDTSWHLVSNNVLYEQKEFIIPDLLSGTWYDLKVTAHNHAGSTNAQYSFATLTDSGGVLPELADGLEMEENVPFYYNVTTIVISVGCLITTMILITVICICCRRRILRSNHDIIALDPPPSPLHAETRPRLLSESVKNVCHSNSSNYLLNSSNRPFIKNGELDTPSSDVARDINPYATSQIPGYYSRDTRTLNQRLSPHVYPPLRDFQEIREGTYPGSRKLTLQRLQQCSRPDNHYSIGYTSPLNSLEDITMALTRIPEFGSQPWLSRPSAPCATEQNVPDLLDHGLESNSSLMSSPEINRHPSKTYDINMRRQGSADSGSDFITQETSFTFVPTTEIKSLHYRADPEYSDTESELDNIHKNKLKGFIRIEHDLPTLRATAP